MENKQVKSLVLLNDAKIKQVLQFFENENLKTFDSSWPHKTGNLTPERMAKAGLRRLKQSDDEIGADEVECFICKMPFVSIFSKF